jgi:hypothetical protein
LTPDADEGCPGRGASAEGLDADGGRLRHGDSAGPDADEGRLGPPRRASLRLFSRGRCRTLDLGAARAAREGGRVVLSPGRPPRGERGFSLLIKEPGPYKLMGLSLLAGGPGRSAEASGAGWGAEASEGEGARFYGVLPLVLRPSYRDDRICPGPGRMLSRSKALHAQLAARSGRNKTEGLAGGGRSEYTDIITAEDPLGVAAFIGIGPRGAALLCRRDPCQLAAAGELVSFSILAGGLDAQRSEQ